MSDTRERIYCVDCRWFRYAANQPTQDDALRYGKCAAMAVRSDGEEFVAPIFEPRRPYASSTRMTGAHCGPDAIKFEPKPIAEAAE